MGYAGLQAVFGPSDQTIPEASLLAKRYNAQLQLLASFLNAIAIGIVGAGQIVPGITHGSVVSADHLVWIAAGIGLHLGAQHVLVHLKKES